MLLSARKAVTFRRCSGVCYPGWAISPLSGPLLIGSVVWSGRSYIRSAIYRTRRRNRSPRKEETCPGAGASTSQAWLRGDHYPYKPTCPQACCLSPRRGFSTECNKGWNFKNLQGTDGTLNPCQERKGTINVPQM